MLGYWCFDFVKSEEDRSYLWKDEDLDACGNHGGMQLLRSSYVLGRFEWRAYCDIAKIEKIADVYIVHANCMEDNEPPRPENFELQLIENGLVRTDLPES